MNTVASVSPFAPAAPAPSSSSAPARPRSVLEQLDPAPAFDVPDAEYHRLLGYPRHHVPGDRARELAAGARRAFAESSRPWIYLREAELRLTPDVLLIDGMPFRSQQLHQHFLAARAQRAVLVAVSAGHGCEDRTQQLWAEGKPDEYFFLEMYGSAVVENLVASLSGRLCDLAEADGLMAIPHYSPGYSGWDIAEQNKLFALLTRSQTLPFPEPIEVLSSGMLRPKKSLLGVFGLTARDAQVIRNTQLVPCENCGFSPCRYRRAPYRHARLAPTPAVSLTPNAPYTVNPRALRKWAQERVRLAPRPNGGWDATFRFDGTTCSNLGRPLAFDYVVTLAPASDQYRILAADCRPTPGEDGYQFTCSYVREGDAHLETIAADQPLLGQPLDEILNWDRPIAPSGCHCDSASRAHKWGLALEVIHYALAQSEKPSS